MSITPPAQQQMAPPAAFHDPKAPDRLHNYAQFLGILRDIRAEVQNLRMVLTSVIERGEMDDERIRAQEVVSAMRSRQPIYTYNKDQVEARIRELRSLIVNAPYLYDRYGDEVTHIENFWERVTLNWPPEIPESAEQVLTKEASQATEENKSETANAEAIVALITLADTVVRKAQETVQFIDMIIYHAALLTIPGRLNQHLEQLRIGQALSFDMTFKDEVPSTTDRRKILEYLSARPAVVQNGIIDIANGVVFHASSDGGRRRLSYFLIALSVIVGALMTFFIAEAGVWFEIENWFVEEGRTRELLIGYSFVIVGGIVHLGIDAVKQARSGTQQTLLAIEDWLLWIHINELGIIIGIMSLWIGFFGLLFIMDEVNWQTAFFVGYSIDSFIDLFLQRFDTAKTAQKALIETQITTTP